MSETTALTNQRAAVDILGRQMIATALVIIKALGGGWVVANLPSRAQAGAR